MAVFASEKTEYKFYLKLTLDEVTPGTATTDPQLSYKLQLYSGAWNFNLLRINAYVKLGGTVVAQLNAADKQWTLEENSSITLLSGTATVPHDGSASMAVEYAIDMDQDFWKFAPDITATGTMDVTGYAKGITHINPNSGLEAYRCYVGNGSSWDPLLPHLGNGSDWDLCS